MLALYITSICIGGALVYAVIAGLVYAFYVKHNWLNANGFFSSHVTESTVKDCRTVWSVLWPFASPFIVISWFVFIAIWISKSVLSLGKAKLPKATAHYKE